MKLFLSRLKETGLIIVASTIIVAVFLGLPFLVMYLLGEIDPDIPTYVITVLFIGFIVYYVGKGLYWLFIEPFIKQKY